MNWNVFIVSQMYLLLQKLSFVPDRHLSPYLMNTAQVVLHVPTCLAQKVPQILMRGDASSTNAPFSPDFTSYVRCPALPCLALPCPHQSLPCPTRRRPTPLRHAPLRPTTHHHTTRRPARPKGIPARVPRNQPTPAKPTPDKASHVHPNAAAPTPAAPTQPHLVPLRPWALVAVRHTMSLNLVPDSGGTTHSVPEPCPPKWRYDTER